MKLYTFPMLSLCLLFALNSTAYAQQNPAVLEPPELREILIRLHQLDLAWKELDLRIRAEQQQRELFERERQLAARELDIEKLNTAAAESEAANEKTRADFYQQAYESVTRKPGFWCGVKKVFTLGLSKCG